MISVNSTDFLQLANPAFPGMSLGGEGHIGKKVVVVWPRNNGLYAPFSLMVQVASTAYCRLAIPIK